MITHLTKPWQLNMFDIQSLYCKPLIRVRDNIKGTKLTIATRVFEGTCTTIHSIYFGWHLDTFCPCFVHSPLKPNDAYIGRTAPLNSRSCILYIYSTNIRTEYFKHAAHAPFFSVQNVVYFIMLPCLVPVLFAFYIQDVLKLKCKIPAPKG